MANKRLLGLATVAVLAASACSSSATTAPSGGTNTGSLPYISIVSKGFQHQFWQAVKKGAVDEATKEGATVNFMGPNTESDVQPQLDMLATELAKKPAAL